MTAVEISLIIIGLIFIVVSFFLQEKLSQKDIDQITSLSDRELKIIVEKQLKNADSKVEDAVDEKLDEIMAASERVMERTSNEKIMAISEYSDTVLESMNKTHNEIMFLYSMLNDKHKELTDLAGELSSLPNTLKSVTPEVQKRYEETVSFVESQVEKAEPMQKEELLEAAVTMTDSERNHNDDILFLHSAGKSDVDIAKELGLGLGEVKLVIGLFKEEDDRAF
ncbi:MAG: DUF6115 domain-containing protein [Agathobacter sp.]